jgi:hypothetical protein
MIALAMQRLSGEGTAFAVALFILTFCSALIGVFFSVVCVDGSIGKLGPATVIGVIYGLIAPFAGEHVALMIIQLAMRIMPLLIILAGLLLMVAWFAPGTGRPLCGIAVLFIVGLLAAAMFGQVADAESGGPGAMAYAQTLIIYSGGFVLGTALAVAH